MDKKNLSGIIVPMTVLAYRVKNGPKKVPTLTPNYKTAKYFALGKDIAPEPFNTNTELQEGIHLHFVLPSTLKHGQTKPASKKIEYPHVPDKYIVTRMYPSIDNDGNKKIIHNCFVVDSSFYSTKKYSNNITIPFKDDDVPKGYRYLGRQYSINENIPEPKKEFGEGHLEDLLAIGPGDPLFNAYYPNCRSVFGFYDNLENVPEDAVLTYSVIGYYSDENKNGIVSILQETEEKVKEEQAKHKEDEKEKTPEQKQQELEQKVIDAKHNTLKKNFKLTLKQDHSSNKVDWNSTLVFGEVCDIDLSKKNPLPQGEINAGIGRTSAEALSAIIAKKYSAEEDIERTLTILQYDLGNEISQIDRNFKIDDNIHSYGFKSIDSIEKGFDIIINKENDDISKEALLNTLSTIQDDYIKLCRGQRKLGELRRKLEYQKKTIYYLWEMYKDYGESTPESLKISNNINNIKNTILNIRKEIVETTSKCIDIPRDSIKKKLEEKELDRIIKIEEVSTKPFYMPKDPALMLFGSGMKRTYAFGEDGRFEKDNTLSCLSSPLLSNNDDRIINAIIFNEKLEKIIDYNSYLNFLVMTVLLDDKNLLPAISTPDDPICINDDRKPSPIMVNKNPDDEVMLFMEWESLFHNNYANSKIDKNNSLLQYGYTDYIYIGPKSKNDRWCIGSSVLTPHGVYNLEEKIQNYIKKNLNSAFSDNEKEELKNLAGQIKDIPAISQNLDGFTINLASLRSTFQMPIDGTDDTTQEVINSLNNKSKDELDIERLAVIEDSDVIPIREGFLDIKNLSIVSSFGNTRKVIEGKKLFSKKEFCLSESLYSNSPTTNGECECFLPLALTTPARLSPHFISAVDPSIQSNSLPETTPIIAVIMPDMLNRNLDIFSNKGELIGVIQTVYRTEGKSQTKTAGHFVQIIDNFKSIDNRLKKFINSLAGEKTFDNESSRLSELMDIIDCKLDNTIPMNQNDFIFGRALVLAEMDIELEYHGGTEFSKKIESVDNLDDNGLYTHDFQVKIGDINRITDGVICGFYNDGGLKNFAPYGYETGRSKFFNDKFPKVSGSKTAKVTLLFDPSLKITLTTGFLPVEQIQVAHTDFSDMDLMLAEMNTLISEENRVQLPDFTNGEKFRRLYSSSHNGDTIVYDSLNIEKADQMIATIGTTMINDGFITKSTKTQPKTTQRS